MEESLIESLNVWPRWKSKVTFAPNKSAALINSLNLMALKQVFGVLP
jgi:hypothetical protein